MPEAAESSFGCGNPLAFSAVKSGQVVVDLGSGAGFDLLLASKKVGPSGKVIGIDMTEDMVKRARQNIRAAMAENVEVRQGLIEELPVESSSVDWVISNCVINLSPEKSLVFKEIYRVLKPGGQIRISDIVAEDLPAELRGHTGLYNSCVAGAISEQAYLTGLRESGLEEVAVEERTVYDRSQISALAEEHGQEITGLFPEVPKTERQQFLNQLIDQLAGNVWSAIFTARKPLQ